MYYTVLQHVLYMDPNQLGYDEAGHCRGEPHPNLPGPQRLQWDIVPEVRLFALVFTKSLDSPCW